MTSIKPATPFTKLPDCNHAFGNEYIGSCEDYYRKIISCRVYFVVIILNFIFVVTTTVYYIIQSVSASRRSSTEQNVSKRWRCYSLRKRSLFGSVVGAIGHLFFSSVTFACQIISDHRTCEMFLWGPTLGFYIWIYAIIWRSIRLYTLIQINDLQNKFLDSSFESKDSSAYRWFMRRKKSLNMSTKSHIFILISSLFVIVIVIILTETLRIRRHGTWDCSPDWGNRLMLGIVVFFFAIILPTIIWFLRRCDDAHGLRLEMWVTAIVGIPCIALFLVWQLVFPSPVIIPGSLRNIFMTPNWIIIVTTTNHIMAIILPVFKILCIGEIETRTYNMIGNAYNTVLYKLQNCYDKINLLGSAHSVDIPQLIPRGKLELTNESLLMVLCDGEMRQILRNWAIKDFTVENILFYEFYLGLVEKLRDVQHITKSIKTNSFYSMRKLSVSNIPITPDITYYYRPSDYQVKLSSHNQNLPIPTPEDLSKIFSIEEMPETVQFYETFISENAPLQVNISYKARENIDTIFKKYAKSSSSTNKTRVSTPDIFSYEMIEKVTQQTKGEPPQFPENECLSLSLFEEATKEVFWNIFTGLYPKVVDYFNNP